MNQLIDRLHADHLSLVILHEGRVATYEGHGVRTLYHILDNEPELLLDAKVAVAAAGDDVIVKVILETCLLTDEEIQEACLVSRDAGADYVKTSTGFSTGGATVEAVSLMKRTVGSDMKVKASGGIHTLEDARKMFYAGADRIGSSSGVAIAEAEMSEIHTI